MTLRGMPSNLALVGSCATSRPPAACTATAPRVPSEPVPESTTATERDPCCSASEWKNASMGSDEARTTVPGTLSTPSRSCSTPPAGPR